MLNEKKIILMTKLASYEQNEGKANMNLGGYFRGDYIGWQVLKSILSATIAFALIFVLGIAYDFEIFMTDIYKMDLMEYAKEILLQFGCFVGAFGIISYIVYSYRYKRAIKSLRLYYHNLKKLEGKQ